MNLSLRGISCGFVLVLTSLAAVRAQATDPKPQDATQAILAAFDRYDVVGLSAAHSNKAQDDFILALIRNPKLPGKVNDLVIECGNRRYQDILDRYIAGADVSIATVRQVWRDTTVAMCGISSFYEAFFPLVRHLNQALPKEQRFRVVAADPPVDWSAGEPATVLRGVDRDGSIATVMTAEVLAKKHKALMLVGTGHLFHNERSRGTAVSAYERTYPGKTFVIETHNGFAAFFDLDRGRQLEARMRSWPIPSIALLEGTWLAQLDLPYFFWPFPRRMAGQRIAELADAYLYLGPGASLTYEKTPTAILDSQSYAAELSRRFHLDVDVLRKRNEDPHLYTLEDRAEARRFAPGVELVGEYAKSPDGAPLVEIDFRDGQLSAKVGSSAWAPLTTDGTSARYRTVGADGNNVFEFDMSGGTVSGLSLTRGSDAVRTRLVRISQ